MSKADDFLVEIGTEELPPKALRSLMDAFAEALTTALDGARLEHGAVHAYASPRRLAVMVEKLAQQQDNRNVAQKGPPVSVAFDSDGKPTPAARAFAKKCGVAVTKLSRNKTSKGEWLTFDLVEKGKAAAELVPGLVESSLASLPIPRRMRWGVGDVEFVRPVHWVVLLHGKKTIAATVMGITAGNKTRGHRVHSSGELTIISPDSYLDILEKEGHVIADFSRRRELVIDGAAAAAKEAGGSIIDGESLYDEVTALVEWPVPLLGGFDTKYLDLPYEVVISTLTGHQRYFPIAGADGNLLPRFVTIANLDSKDPDQVRSGNERVIRPRLADAAFFWDTDRRVALTSRQDALNEVVYQHGLGSLFDRSRRIAELAEWLAAKLNMDSSNIKRAATLAKCDLLTGMVGEFPELQGTMGRYYATSDGEPDDVAIAIGEHYLPRYAGDKLPASKQGQVLAVADKIDTLAGIFSLGKRASGNRDPFGLRRAALGIVRILIEGGLDIDLKALAAKALAIQPAAQSVDAAASDELYVYITDRLRRYFLDRDPGLTSEAFDAVMVRQPASLVDFDRRLAAVQTFARLEQAASLAAANKRIANILHKAGAPEGLSVNRKLLQEEAEQALFNSLVNAQRKVKPLLEVRGYAEILNELAELRDPVDRFFDNVLVMADDEKVKANRLALLSKLRALFLDVADISRLSIG